MPLHNRREHIRYEVGCDIECVIESEPAKTVIRGELINLSEGGVCIKLPRKLAEDEKLLLRGRFRGSMRTGSVRWVRRVSVDACLIGIMFSRKIELHVRNG